MVTSDSRNVKSGLGKKIKSFPVNEVKFKNSFIFDEGWMRVVRDMTWGKPKITKNSSNPYTKICP